MTLILDSSGLLAAGEALESARGPLLVPPFVLAELDYMIMTRMGRGRELLSEVVRGAYRLEPFSAEDVAEAVSVI